jgi:hypothetical protein
MRPGERRGAAIDPQAFILRPVRGARRGDVVDIRIAFATANRYADGRPIRFTARWRTGL